MTEPLSVKDYEEGKLQELKNSIKDSLNAQLKEHGYARTDRYGLQHWNMLHSLWREYLNAGWDGEIANEGFVNNEYVLHIRYKKH